MDTDDIRHSAKAQTTAATPVPSFPPLPVVDNGRVRLGGQAPLFQAAIADNGQIRIGGQAPLFVPAIIADAGLVRLGGQSPAF